MTAAGPTNLLTRGSISDARPLGAGHDRLWLRTTRRGIHRPLRPCASGDARLFSGHAVANGLQLYEARLSEGHWPVKPKTAFGIRVSRPRLMSGGILTSLPFDYGLLCNWTAVQRGFFGRFRRLPPFRSLTTAVRVGPVKLHRSRHHCIQPSSMALRCASPLTLSISNAVRRRPIISTSGAGFSHP